MSYPYVIYSSQFTMSSLKRILIWTFVTILLIITLFVYTSLTFGHPLFWLGALVIVALFTWGGVKWMGSMRPDEKVALRFDRECRNFSYETKDKKIQFTGLEARPLGVQSGNLLFEVRGEKLSFPLKVSAVGNIRTVLHLKGGGEYLFLDLLSVVSKIDYSFSTEFRGNKLEVRAHEFFTGEPVPYNRIF